MNINHTLTRTRTLLALLLLLLGTAATLAQQDAPPALAPNDFAAVKAIQPIHEKAALIRLRGEVDDMMRKSLERRIDIARKAGCTLIVYDIDTFGGLLTSGIEISKLTKKLPAQHLNTVAWINDKAYSAGALIAVSCQQIVMVKGSSIGDCAPILISEHTLIPLPPTERAKINSPLIQEFEDSATVNHYDKTILRAMVDAETEIHEMQNAITGDTRYVGTKEKEALLAVEVPADGGKQHPWHFVKTIVGPGELLTVNAARALNMGISKANVDNEQELRAVLNIRGDLLVLDFNWAEIATVWLVQPWVRYMLFVSMLVLAWIEFSHPGLTAPGIAAILCLVLLVGAPFLTGLAQIWEIALIIVGLGIIVSDLVVFGGIGLLAVPGFILMAIGLVASFVPAEPGSGFVPHMDSTWTALRNGLTVVVFGSLSALVAFFLLSRYLYMTPGFRRLQLAPALRGGPPADTLVRDAADRSAHDAVFLGALGTAATDLRPSGKVRFGDHLVDVVSFGNFIHRDSEVEVVEVSGNHVVVKPRNPTLTPPASPPSAAPGGAA